MKNTAKITGLFTLLFLLTSGMIVSMDRPEEEYSIRVKQNISHFPSVQIQGIVELLPGCPVGFCSKEDIELLNKIGIPADENTPVVPISNIFVENPKVDQNAEYTYSNWLEEVPKVLVEYSSNHIDAAITEENVTIQELWRKNTRESIGEVAGRQIAIARGETEARETIKKCTFPPMLPVISILHRSETIQFSNVFGFCDVSLLCDRADLLTKIDAFNQKPGIIIPFDGPTIKKMKQFDAAAEDMQKFTLAQSAINAAGNKTGTTVQQLVISEVISSREKETQSNVLGCGNTCAYYDLNRAPAQNFPDIRKMTLEDNFPKKNTFKALQGRELGYK